jgi:uncharacterized caspase-like protein/WD40 repeat protein
MIHAVAISPDGGTVACSVHDGMIYLFNRASGQMMQCISSSSFVYDLEFSDDGRHLAAVGWPTNGVRVFNVADGSLAGEDEYHHISFGVDFAPDGRLVTTCLDGFVRLYSKDLTMLQKRPAPGGRRIYGVAFSQDGSKIAVGYQGAKRVDVLAASGLSLMVSLDFSGGNNDSVLSVEFSCEGGYLYASGKGIRGKRRNYSIRRWSGEGKGQWRDLPASNDSIGDLTSLPGGGVAFVSGGPAIGVLNAEGTRTVFNGPPMVKYLYVSVSGDGSTVRFSYDMRNRAPALLLVAEGLLDVDSATDYAIASPRTTSTAIEVTGWQYTREPRLNGKRIDLSFELSTALAIAPDDHSFLLGGDNLRLFDKDGTKLWKKSFPGVARAVNISGDGKLAVAAFADGAIRWFRMSNGEELLAFFPHVDRKRWVLWTPSGYYTCSPGGANLLGWHVNRGPDRAADFYHAAKFKSTHYRPDVVKLVLSTLSEEQAVQLAEKAAGRFMVQPPDLSLKVTFSDSDSVLPNRMIDGGEMSVITVTVTNEGKGDSGGVLLVIGSNTRCIDFDKLHALGDLAAGESGTVNVNIKGGANIGDGEAVFRIQCKEQRGFDSKQYLLKVSTAHMRRPEVSVARYEVRDCKAGLAEGNCNGVVENDETIELIAFIHNSGEGAAVDLGVSLEVRTPGVTIQQGQFMLPRLEPGQVLPGSVAFSVARVFSTGEIECVLSAAEERGVATAYESMTFTTGRRTPRLELGHTLLDDSGDGVLASGEQGRLQLDITNAGDLEAREVEVSIRCPDLICPSQPVKIETIGAESKRLPVHFTLIAPRTMEAENGEVIVTVEQEGFDGLKQMLHLPYRRLLPELRITCELDDADHNGRIEHGETVNATIMVSNEGELAAEDVSIELLTDDGSTIAEGILLLGSRQLRSTIGTVNAGSFSVPRSFSFHVQRRARPGEARMLFNIEQQGFPGRQLPVAFTVVEEQSEVITVSGEQPEVGGRGGRVFSPPVIAIAWPRDGASVLTETVQLRGTAADDRGVVSIAVSVNGRHLEGVDRRITRTQGHSRERELSVEVPLDPGANQIVVTARDTDFLSAIRKLTVIRDREEGELWAVVIGIDRYESPKIQNLELARDDGEAFAGYLRSNMGLDDDHLRELYDEQATLQVVKSTLGTWLRRNATSTEDTVYIFYAGHGAPEPDSSGRESDGISKYILPYNADPDDLYSTALPMDEIATIFSRISSQRVIFIADSCYSGGSGGRTIPARGRFANLSDRFLERIAAGKGRVILTSCGANEVSRESKRLGHGYFTHYLLRGLKREADANEPYGLIDIEELYRYLSDRVAKATDNLQHPVKKGESEGLLIVGRVSEDGR